MPHYVVVTAPTNGSAGVIPVLMYYLVIETIKRAIRKLNIFTGSRRNGSIFKKRIYHLSSHGRLQTEIGVSSAMAAAL
jgi:L-serine dehydratase